IADDDQRAKPREQHDDSDQHHRDDPAAASLRRRKRWRLGGRGTHRIPRARLRATTMSTMPSAETAKQMPHSAMIICTNGSLSLTSDAMVIAKASEHRPGSSRMTPMTIIAIWPPEYCGAGREAGASGTLMMTAARACAPL